MNGIFQNPHLLDLYSLTECQVKFFLECRLCSIHFTVGSQFSIQKSCRILCHSSSRNNEHDRDVFRLNAGLKPYGRHTLPAIPTALRLPPTPSLFKSNLVSPQLRKKCASWTSSCSIAASRLKRK